MSWDWSFALDTLPDLLSAFLRYTLVATVLGTVLAALLGLAFAIVRRAHVPVLAPLVTAFIEFIRSTPLIVQLFFLFFVLPGFGVTLSPLTTGVLGLGVHYACYLAEVYRAGIEGVAKGQWEAATALSLPPRLQWQHVILPQAIRSISFRYVEPFTLAGLIFLAAS